MALINLQAREIDGLPTPDDPAACFQVRPHPTNHSLVVLDFLGRSVAIHADALQFAIQKAVELSVPRSANNAT